MRTIRRLAADAAPTAVAVLVMAAYPRVARFAYAPGFASPSGVQRYVLARAAITFAIFQWQAPRAMARLQRWEAATAELNDRLGRQPTPEEYFENWRRTQAAWKAAGRPRPWVGLQEQ